MALIKSCLASRSKIAVDSVYMDSINGTRYCYPARIDSDGTVATPGRTTSKPTSGEFWSVSNNNIVATKACHITGYYNISGNPTWASLDVTCAIGDTIASTQFSAIDAWVMRAEL